MSKPITKTITATELDENLNIRTLSFICEVADSRTDIVAAMKAAAKDFCLSDEGEKIYRGNCYAFNWGDFAIYVPEEYQRKHGFHVINIIGDDTIIRDFNEQLVCEQDIFPEE